MKKLLTILLLLTSLAYADQFTSGKANARSIQGKPVNLTSLTDGDVLTWVAANSDFENKPAAGAACPTCVTSASTLTSTGVLIGGGSRATSTSTALTFTGTTLSVGVAATGTGVLALVGNTSGTVSLTAQATAGTPTVTFGTSSGTPAVTASAPLSITTATGNITCTTCATTTNGGALSGTSPVAISAAGAISLSGTAGQVPNGATGAFTATPTLGIAGTTAGTLTLSGLTSGTATLGVDATAANFTTPAGLIFSGASGAPTTISTTTTNASLLLAPNGTGAVVFNNGTAANPSIGDAALATTGLYWPSNASFGVVFNGVEKERIIGGEVETIGTGGFTFAATTIPGTRATGISQNGAGIVCADTSTIGNCLGTFDATNFQLFANGSHIKTAAANKDAFGTCTAAAATTCTITFTTAYTSAPSCVAVDETNITTLKVTPSTTTLVITTTGSTSDKFDYHCAGNPN